MKRIPQWAQLTRKSGTVTALLLATLSSQALAAASMTEVIEVPGTAELLNEDTANRDPASEFKTLYYIPHGARLARDGGSSEFTFSWLPARESQVTMNLELAPSKALEDAIPELRRSTAARYGVAEAKVRILPIPMDATKVEVFAPNDTILDQIIPPNDIPQNGKFPFYFHFSATGTTWFREQVVERRWRFAQLEAMAIVENTVESRLERRPLRFPLFVEVPRCAVAFDSCFF